MKEKLLAKLNELMKETDKAKLKAREENNLIDEAFYVGKSNGLLWAEIFILEIEAEKED